MAGKAIIALLLWASLAYGKDTRVKIALIDSGMPKGIAAHALCEGAKDFSGTGMVDNLGHATAVSCILTKGLDFNKVCILPIKYIDMQKPLRKAVLDGWYYAQAMGVKYVNYSSAGFAPLDGEDVVLKSMTRRGIVIVAAAGNHDVELDHECDEYVACYRVKHIRIVGALNDKGGKAAYSNWGSVVTHWASDSKVLGCGYFTGTSAATPKVLNTILKQAGYGVK